MFWRTIAAMAALALLLYVGYAAALYFNQRQMLYHPEATWRVRQAPDIELDRDGVVLRGWVMNPGEARAAVLRR